MLWILLLGQVLLAGVGETQSCIPGQMGGATNVARGRPAFQSSIYPHKIPGSAEKAVDGNCDGDFHHGSCIHTQLESEPWWYLDLGRQHAIFAVVVKNRADCCWDRLQGTQVHVGGATDSFSKLNPVCGPIINTSSGFLSTVYCIGLKGRYVSIVMHGRTDHLHVCEVEVYGFPLEC